MTAKVSDPIEEKNRKSRHYCSVRDVPEQVFSSDVDPGRARLILISLKKWVNGTVLKYYFFNKQTDGENVLLSNGTRKWRSWTTTETQKEIVRKAFGVWADLKIGIKFQEVKTREEAKIRIGFMDGDGSWSYIGREILGIGLNERTMNFGWDLTNEIDTATHEIGHTLGFPHEHQNPIAGIVWDEEAVYAELAKPPNEWPRSTTYNNIIRKIQPDTVQASEWDRNSIMHYPFGPGLVKEPIDYRKGIFPKGGLSPRDKQWALTFYPPLNDQNDQELKPLESLKLGLLPTEQKNLVIQPSVSQYYEIRTLGLSDTIMVLFEDNNGELRYLTGEDDGGKKSNGVIRIKLFSDRKYILRIRLYHADNPDEVAVMLSPTRLSPTR